MAKCNQLTSLPFKGLSQQGFTYHSGFDLMPGSNPAWLERSRTVNRLLNSIDTLTFPTTSNSGPTQHIAGHLGDRLHWYWQPNNKETKKYKITRAPETKIKKTQTYRSKTNTKLSGCSRLLHLATKWSRPILTNSKPTRSDTIQMTHDGKCDMLKYICPEAEMSTQRRSPSVDISTEGHI